MTPTIFIPQKRQTTNITCLLNTRHTKVKEIQNLKKQIREVAADISNPDERELLLETLWDLRSELIKERRNF